MVYFPAEWIWKQQNKFEISKRDVPFNNFAKRTEPAYIYFNLDQLGKLPALIQTLVRPRVSEANHGELIEDTIVAQSEWMERRSARDQSNQIPYDDDRRNHPCLFFLFSILGN